MFIEDIESIQKSSICVYAYVSVPLIICNSLDALPCAPGIVSKITVLQFLYLDPFSCFDGLYQCITSTNSPKRNAYKRYQLMYQLTVFV